MRSKRSEVKVVDVQSAEKINGKMSCFETVTESMQFAEAACKSHQEWRMKIYLNGQRRVSKLWHHPLLGYMAHTNFNKKVMAIPQTHVKILPLYSLITLQNLVTVSHTMCAHVGDPKKCLARWYPSSSEWRRG